MTSFYKTDGARLVPLSKEETAEADKNMLELLQKKVRKWECRVCKHVFLSEAIGVHNEDKAT